FAEVGQFTNAVQVEREAIALATNDATSADFVFRLKIYQSNRAYRDPDELAGVIDELLNLGKYADAEPLARERLALWQAKLPEGWKTFGAMSSLGAVLCEQKKYAEAEPLLISGYSGLKQRRDTLLAEGGDRMAQQALEFLWRLFKETERPD